jgi:hypothetical protein
MISGAQTNNTVQGPKGEVRFRYLERRHEGRVLIAPLPDLRDSDYLTHDVLELLCQRLEIPPQIFY